MASTVHTRVASLSEMFSVRAQEHGSAVAYRYRPPGEKKMVDVSFAAAHKRISAVAAGLLSTEGGVAPGAAVAILAQTRLEWVLCDFAALSIGAVVVPVYASLLPAEVGFLHVDAGIEVTIVEDKEGLEKVRAIRNGFTFLDKRYDAAQLKLRRVIVMDPTGITPAEDWESLFDVEARGNKRVSDTADERAQRARAVTREHVATITYTSGTTGAPKGVVQTHGNWLSVLDVSEELGMFTPHTREIGAFLFLPLAHAFGRLIEWGAVYFGSLTILSSVESLLEDLQATRPGFVPSAPRMYEKMYARILSLVASASPRRQQLFQWALAVGKATIPYRQKNKDLPLVLKAQHRVADRLVLSKLRARLGLDRIESMATGSAPLAPAVHEFFLSIGVLLLEGYGLTETCPILTVNRPAKWKLGSVGPVIRGVELKIAADGEVLARGPNVVSGYHNRPDANAEAFVDGWFHTGDIGEIDVDGFLRITDRKKDLLKTSGGKFVAPVKVEGLLKSKPPISEAMVIGDNRKYCTALLVLDEDGVKAWAARTGNAPDARGDPMNKHLQGLIDEVNRDLASFESIKYFRVVPEAFAVENGMLTASFKVKRKAVLARYADLIETMYGENAKAHAA
jgi:long-chain acyl-CoA synthetase